MMYFSKSTVVLKFMLGINKFSRLSDFIPGKNTIDWFNF